MLLPGKKVATATPPAPTADHHPLATRPASRSSLYTLLDHHGLLCRDYAVASTADLGLIPGRATRRQVAFWRAATLGCFCRVAEVPAGQMQEYEDGVGNFLLLGKGLHLFKNRHGRLGASHSLKTLSHVQHGDITLVVISDGAVGYATDRGTPVLLPPGMHMIRSETLRYEREIRLDGGCVVRIGGLTLVVANEGKSAVTQNNGRLVVLPGGRAHLLDHANWFFEKFVSTKIQSARLDSTKGSTRDNVAVEARATFDWRVDNVATAAMQKTIRQNASRTSGKDMGQLALDVSDAVASALSGLISRLNYSSTFTFSDDDPERRPQLIDEHQLEEARRCANNSTNRFGVTVLDLAVINLRPTDSTISGNLSQGAVAAARAHKDKIEARLNEAKARARAKALRIEAEGRAAAAEIDARSAADAERIRAVGAKAAADLIASNNVASDLARIKATGDALRGGKNTFMFGGDASSSVLGRMLVDRM